MVAAAEGADVGVVDGREQRHWGAGAGELVAVLVDHCLQGVVGDVRLVEEDVVAAVLLALLWKEGEGGLTELAWQCL